MSPFDLKDDNAYQAWRAQKLADYPTDLSQLTVPLADPGHISETERQALAVHLAKCNLAIFSSEPREDKELISALGRQLGLRRIDNNLYADEDAISSLQVTVARAKAGYIPYSNRPLAWHTDGYYNSGDQQIRAFLLYCVRPAQSGGSNRLLDHEIAYILLRDRDPAYVAALMHPEAMTIPANVMDGNEVRPAVSGPVFSVLTDGTLHMRYTARRRNILWRDDPLTREAVTTLSEILETETPYHFQGTLAAGQGLICNNVPHTRSGFEEDSNRLLYRARYFDRITL